MAYVMLHMSSVGTPWSTCRFGHRTTLILCSLQRSLMLLSLGQLKCRTAIQWVQKSRSRTQVPHEDERIQEGRVARDQGQATATPFARLSPLPMHVCTDHEVPCMYALLCFVSALLYLVLTLFTDIWYPMLPKKHEWTIIFVSHSSFALVPSESRGPSYIAVQATQAEDTYGVATRSEERWTLWSPWPD
jgi:hypothetical protein